MSAKSLWWLLAGLLLAGCACTKTSIRVTDPALIRARPQPVTIFGIGGYGKTYMVLILVDARGQYLTVIIPRSENLQKGQAYTP